MKCMSLTKTAILLKFKLVWCLSLIFGGRIVALLAFRTPKRNDISHTCFLLLLKLIIECLAEKTLEAVCAS